MSRSYAVEAAREVVTDLLALARPLQQHTEIVPLLPKRLRERLVVLKAPPLLQDLLRGGLVFPEIGRGDARFELGQLFGDTRFVKDSSANRLRAW